MGAGENGAPIRVAVCGLGSVGRRVAQLLLERRRGIEVVGAATLEQELIGRPLGAAVGAKKEGPTVVGELDEVLATRPQAIIYSTGSFLAEVEDDVIECARSGVNVVSPCEELAFPFSRQADAAARIDAAARAGGATVLGTGVNPGFTFDSLLVALTGLCWDVTAIRGRRVVDTNGFGENIHRRLGIGFTTEEFEAGHRDGSIAGHVGFPESIEMVCERLGLALDSPVAQTFEPLVAESPAPTRYGAVPAGCTEGFIQRAVGWVDGEARVTIELILHLRPVEADYSPADTIEIDGTHSVRMTLDPGVDPLLGTAAVLVNAVPVVLSAGPGLRSVKDLPVSAAWLGDLREAVSR